MEHAALFEQTIEINRGHGCVTVSVELGDGGAVQLAFRGREAPSVVYQYDEPLDALAIGTALIKAAQAARAAAGTEAG